MLIFAERVGVIAKDFCVVDVEPIVSFLISKPYDISSVTGDVFGDIDGELLGFFGGGADNFRGPMPYDGSAHFIKSIGIDQSDFSVGIVTSIAVNAGFELVFLSGFEVGDIDEV